VNPVSPASRIVSPRNPTHLLVHVLQLVRGKCGAELLAHRLPPFAAREEYVVVQRIRVRAGVQTAVGEVVKVFDQYVT
jgi:hypothetical protein